MNCANYYWLCGGIIITVYTREKRFLFLSYTQIHTFEEDIWNIIAVRVCVVQWHRMCIFVVVIAVIVVRR